MILFTDFYKHNYLNQTYIIENNIQNKFISKIVLFVDEETSQLIQNPKVVKIKINFQDLDSKLNFCSSQTKSDICIVSNQLLNETVINLINYNFNQSLLVVKQDTYIFQSNSPYKRKINDDNIIDIGLPLSRKIEESKNIRLVSNLVTSKLDVVIIAVDYNDYLDITLKNNIKYLNNIHVVTSTTDIDCQELCRKYNVDCIVTDCFYQNGDKFNKARALNHAISSIDKPSWILTLDADILVHDSVDVSNLNIDTLYSTHREVIRDGREFTKYLAGQEYVSRIEPNIGFGYYQLFNIHSRFLSKGLFMDSFTDASRYDVEFKKRFKKVESLNQKVIHIGPTKINWIGRKSNLLLKNDNLKFDINDYFDKIYCINLDRRFDRWLKVNNEFKRLRIDVTRFSAVEGRDIDGGNFTMACLLSHIEIIKEAKRNNFKRILIFEDDIIFEKDFIKKIKYIKSLNWKLLYLGASQFSWSLISISDGSYYCNKTLGSFAYAIDSSIYDDILSFSNNLHKPYDHHLVEIQKKYKSESIAIYPNLVISTVDDSDISQKKSMSEYSKQMRWNLSDYRFNKTISIIIPCYGQSKYLIECVESCLNQSVSPNEIVILLMDEDSKNMRTEIESKSPIIRCFELDRLDLSSARNFCVDQTTSDFFIPLDADDKLPKNFLEKVSEHDADVVYVGSRYFGSIQGTWPDPIDEEVDWIKLTTFRRNSLVCTALIRKESFYSSGRYNQDLWAYEDMDLWIRMYRDGYKFIKCKETYLEYRKHGSSLIKKTNSNSSNPRFLKSIITKDRFYSRTPKIIHFVWLGDKPIVQHIIDNWKEKLPEPEWRYMMWNESNFDIESSDFLSKSYSQKKYGICVDYIRAHVLYEYGGIWLDTDCIINQDISCFLQYDFFSSWENSSYINIGLIGCSPKLQIFENILDYYTSIKVSSSTFNNNQKFVNSIGTGPMVLTREISKFYDIQNGGFTIEFNLEDKRYIIETPDVFVLDDSNSGRQNFAVHLFDGSWTDKKEEWSVVVKREYERWKIKNKIL